MSGHSHWATIKHKKGAADARKGQMFSKLARYITVAAKNGGGDPETNIKLLYAVQKAREFSMPRDTIDKAIKKGTGEIEGVTIDEVVYEGYAHGGVAILVEAVTDNKNRSVSEIRKIFETRGGSLAGANSVAWMFETKGLLGFPKAGISEDALTEAVLDAGADDLSTAGELYEVTCDPRSLEIVKKALEAKGFKSTVSEVAKIPKNYVPLDQAAADRVMGLVEELEGHDDVQNVHTNFELVSELASGQS